MKAKKNLTIEDIQLLHKLSDQLVTAQSEIEQLRTRRDDNREVLSMFKENKLKDAIKENHFFMNVGKQFIKNKKADAYIFIESDQNKVVTALKEKEKLVEELKKRIRKLNPKLDLVEYDAYSIIVKDLEDEEEWEDL